MKHKIIDTICVLAFFGVIAMMFTTADGEEAIYQSSVTTHQHNLLAL